MAEEIKKLWVKAARPPADKDTYPKDGSPCFWDRHPDHETETGEVFVTEDKPVKVAATPLVLDALAKGQLVETRGAHADPGQPAEGKPAQPSIGGEAPGDAADKAKK